MSIQQNGVVSLGPNQREEASATIVDESGRSIIALLGRAADQAKSDCAKAMELAHKLAFQVRAAEERARDSDERVRELEAEVAHFRDRALRAEDWLRHIHNEVEQAFFKKNGGGPPQLPRKNGTTGKLQDHSVST